MVLKCPKGKIVRAAYTRADGTRVRATCIPDKGLPGKTPKSKKVLPKPVAGNLGKYGYHDIKNMTAAQRHKALTKGVKAAGYATIIQRINLVANYNKRTDPRVHKLMRDDINWIRNNLYKYSASGEKPVKKADKKTSKRSGKLIKASKVTVGGKDRQLYTIGTQGKPFYRYKKRDGTFGKRYI